MKKYTEYKSPLRKALYNATGCTIQHDGWTCGSCFFAIDDSLNNQDWQTVLLIRGDTDEEYLNNLPQDIEKSVKKILRLCK